MNKMCKQYIGEIKTMLPLKRKQEREFIKKLALDVQSYCEDANVATKQELYDNYGKPIEVVSNYISAMDSDYIIKRMRFSKVIRICATLLIAAIIVATTAYCINQHLMRKIWNKNIDGAYVKEYIIVEEVIE